MDAVALDLDATLTELATLGLRATRVVMRVLEIEQAAAAGLPDLGATRRPWRGDDRP